jgi:outer membrane lipoprotein SlyB
VVHQRDQRGDRADRECRAAFGERVKHHARLEAVAQRQRRSQQEGQRHMADQPGDVEQRGDAEHAIGFGQPDPVAVDLCRERDIAVAVHRAFRQAGGAGGVDQQRDVIRAEADRGRALAAMAGDHLGQRAGAGAGRGLRRQRAEHAGIVAGLIVAGGRGQHLNRRVLGQRRLHGFDEGFRMSDDQLRRAVREQQAQFALAVHRVQRHRDRAGLPGRNQADDEGRHVLQHQRHAVAVQHAIGDQRGGQRITAGIEFGVTQRAVEIVDRRAVRRTRHSGTEHRQRVVMLDGRRGRAVRRVLAQPCGIGGHRRAPSANADRSMRRRPRR